MTFGIPKYGRKIFGRQFLLNMFIYICLLYTSDAADEL